MPEGTLTRFLLIVLGGFILTVLALFWILIFLGLVH